MTDRKRPLGGDDDFDWDAALDEWEQKSFSPEVAKDKDTGGRAAMTGADVPAPSREPVKTPPLVAAYQEEPPAAASEAADPADDGTRIASAPDRVDATRSAGLGQLFGRAGDSSPSNPDLPAAGESVEVAVGFDDETSDLGAHEAPTAPPPGAPQLLVPLEREHDPDQETAAFDTRHLGLPLTPDHSSTTEVERGEEDAPDSRQLAELEELERVADAETGGDQGDEQGEQGEQVDQDAETAVRASAAAPAPRLDELEPPPSILPPSMPPVPSQPPPIVAPRRVPELASERPAAAWLDDASRAEMAARAVWLEDEARQVADATTRARAFLAVSEIRAIAGDTGEALRLATEACDVAPELPLAQQQALALTPPSEIEQVLARAHAAARAAPTPAAKVHEYLLAGDVARLSGDDDTARALWSEAAGVTSPPEPRVLLLRAAHALAAGDTSSEPLRVTPVAGDRASEAIAAALRSRGLGDDAAASAGARPADVLRRARTALAAGDVLAAATALAELRSIGELTNAAAWLASTLASTRPEGRDQADAILAALGDRSARRARAARALEAGNAEAVRSATSDASTFTAAERLVLALLVPARGDDHGPEALDEAIADPELAPLAAAASGVERASTPFFTGDESSQRAVRLARLIARGGDDASIEAALRARRADAIDEVRALEIDAAARGDRWVEVAEALAAWGGAAPRDALLTAGLVAERAGDRERAARFYREAHDQGATDEAALRAAAALDAGFDVARALVAVGEARGEGVAGALAFVEAVSHPGAGALEDPAAREALERAHHAAPSLPYPTFLAERLARRAGDVEGVLAQVRARHAEIDDGVERALDAVREALLVADTDAALATERLEEAHRTRTSDIALRELYERVAAETPSDRASWRETRAAEATGEAKGLLLLEAAHEYERVGDTQGAVRAARAALEATTTDAGPASLLPRIVLERTEVLAGEASRLSDELLAQARATEDPVLRREAYERLSDLDLTGRHDAGSALLWHRSILEDFPEHLPSLRYVEHALLSEGRDDELEPVATSIAKAVLAANERADAAASPDAVAHALLAARLRMRRGDWAMTGELAEMVAKQTPAPLWALRLRYAHARAAGEPAVELSTTLELLERTSRQPEVSSLLLRASDAAARAGDAERARELAERAANEDPADLVAFDRLVALRREAGDARGVAETLESVARVAAATEHQLAAWHAAALTWIDDVKGEDHVDRGLAALEQAAAIDVDYQDVFSRLSQAYAQKGAKSELAQLLEKKVETVVDPVERLDLEVERGRVLAEVGDPGGARRALESALEIAPDHEAALRAYGDLCAETADWDAAEQAWVRLARLLQAPYEQREIYVKLGDLYSTHAVNLARAEVALKEVLKRTPEDLPTLEKLVDVYQRQNDAPHALEIQQQLIARAANATDRRRRLVELAKILEETAHDNRKAEQALETARREFPSDVAVLRALAGFYTRHNQTAAVHVLLDRASADARRAFAAGRFAPPLFETMATVYELRGKTDAAEAVRAAASAFTGERAHVRGAEGRAGDPRLDDLLAPDVVIPALRALLARTGDALDAVVPLDPRSVRAAPLPPSANAIAAIASSLAVGMGIQGLTVLVSPQIGQTCVPASSSPPVILVGERLLAAPNVLGRTFLLARALKLVQARASALLRIPPKDLPVLVAAWLRVFNPNWSPQGINSAALAEASRRLQAALPRRLDQDVGLMALEVAGSVGGQAAALGPAVLTWADRTALLAVGDPGAALDAIAWSLGSDGGAPPGTQERAAFVARTPEAREILAFAVSEAYADARVRSGAAR